ncbi:MAG: hypothetical protein JNL40_12135 [Cyclobacteriaceae bacterium]|nr:hypothetical protein [Cyclobacteriaceae bacterium]
MKGSGWLFVGFLAIGCTHQPQDEIIPVCSADVPVSFQNSIQPTINATCSYSGCHDGANGRIPRLITLEEVQANTSDIYFQLTRGAMPPVGSARLTAREKAVILCWIQQGAK